jgi:hypothetical protein
MRGRKTWPVAGKKAGGDVGCRQKEGQRELGPGGDAGCRREEGEAGLGPGCDAGCRREEGEAGFGAGRRSTSVGRKESGEEMVENLGAGAVSCGRWPVRLVFPVDMRGF